MEVGVVMVSSPEYTRMKKSPVNASLQGKELFPRLNMQV